MAFYPCDYSNAKSTTLLQWTGGSGQYSASVTLDKDYDFIYITACDGAYREGDFQIGPNIHTVGTRLYYWYRQYTGGDGGVAFIFGVYNNCKRGDVFGFNCNNDSFKAISVVGVSLTQ